MRIPHSTVGRRDGEQQRWAPLATLTSSWLVGRNLASAFALGFGKENASALIKALEAKADVAVKAA